MTEPTGLKDYLGDGVYIDYDGYSIILTTEDGVSVQNRIFMEPQVMQAFQRYIERILAILKERKEAEDAEGQDGG